MKNKVRKRSLFFYKKCFRGHYDSRYLISDYKRLYVGFSHNKTHREQGSSGGIGTEISSFLLENKLVDKVIGVGFSKDPPYLPEYQTVEDVKEVTQISGSKYIYMSFYPLRKLIESEKEKKLAVFLQPCFIKAVRKMQKNEYRNIHYIISFFCGYNITREATDYLIKKAKVKKEDIAEISYRWGEYPGGFMVRTKDDQMVNFGKECYEIVDLMFLRRGCKQCHLYMGEGADIVLGDAWIKSLQNASIVIARNETGADVIENMAERNKIKLYEIKEKELVRMHWHNLKYKKYGMSVFLNFMHYVLKTNIMKKAAPFKLFMFLSRIRRRLAIGIDLELKKD